MQFPCAHAALCASLTFLLPATLRAQADLLQRLPQAFVENKGQWESKIRFKSRKGSMTAWFHDRAWTFALERVQLAHEGGTTAPKRPGLLEAEPPDGIIDGVAITMSFVGAGVSVPTGRAEQAGTHNFFLGNDSSRWVSGARGFSRLRYRSLYKGVDVVIRAEASRAPGGIFEYDLCLAPGADLGAVVLQCEGSAGLRVERDGSLVMATALGNVVQKPPLTWTTESGGDRRYVPCRYVLLGDGRFGFEARSWDRSRPLTVDPGLVWASYLGGIAADSLRGVDVHASGAITVVGNTSSSQGIPLKNAYQTSLRGSSDVFVTRFAADGSSLIFSTYLGGSSSDGSWKLSVDNSLQTTLCGCTGSFDFPTTQGAFQTFLSGGGDAFAARLSANGGQIVFATYAGGSNSDCPQSFHVAANGITAIGGTTMSYNFPTTSNAQQRTFGGGPSPGDGYVTIFDNQGKGLYSSYVGGNQGDWVSGMTAGPGPVVTFALGADSTNLPTTANAYQPIHAGGTDLYIARVQYDATSSKLLYASYLGQAQNQWPFGCHVDGNGVITVAGGGGMVTTPGAYLTSSPGGNSDGFAARLDPSQARAKQLVYSTYVGGAGYDNCTHLHVDAAGIATVIGFTDSPDFPTTPGALQTSFGGGNTNTWWMACDGYIARFRMDTNLPRNQQLLYGSYIGVPNSATNEFVWDVHVGADGVATLVGWAENGFPTRDGFQNNYGGGTQDGLLMRLVTTPGYGTFGATCAQSATALVPDVTRLPRLGRTMAVNLVNPPSHQAAIVFLSFQRLANPVDLTAIGMPGCLLHVTPDLPFVIGPAQFTWSVPVPNLAALLGGEFFHQALVFDSAANKAGLVLTNAGLGRIGY